MGPKPNCFRYHQILGDGHRNHFNLALQFWATALALKAAIYDKKLPAEIASYRDSHHRETIGSNCCKRSMSWPVRGSHFASIPGLPGPACLSQRGPEVYQDDGKGSRMDSANP